MNHQPAPEDIVARPGPTPETVATIKGAAGQPVTITFPAEIDITTDSEGNPLGVEETAPAQTVTAILGTIRTHNQENQR
jgi:hypothetical protein